MTGGAIERVAAEVARQLERDLAMLEEAATAANPAFRCWRCSAPAVVLGRASKLALEANEDFCRRHRIPVVRRQSGGGAVLIEPGTLQWSCALPIRGRSPFASIAKSKAFCNELLRTALPGGRRLNADPGGDLILQGRKVGGVALKRRREAVLLHGTLLATADLDLIAAALRHPPREPDYRGGRGHLEFLANFGPIDAELLERSAGRLLAGLRPLPA